jgi:hypothetical protein
MFSTSLPSTSGVSQFHGLSVPHRQREPIRVIQRIVARGAVVEAEDLLRDIAVEMKRLDGNIDPAQCALQKAPEVIDSLGMNVAANVLFNVIYGRVGVILGGKIVIGWRSIGVDRRATFNLVKNLILKGFALHVWNNLGRYLTAYPVKHTHDLRRGVLTFITMYLERLERCIFGLWADVDFVHLYRPVAAHLCETTRHHRLPDAMEHEPCGLLGKSEGAVNLIRTDAVLASCQHPDRHPFVHAERRIFKDSSNLDRKLLFAAVAEPYTPSLDEGMLLRSATWAVNLGVWPAKLDSIAESSIGVGEVLDQCRRSR